MSNDLPAVPSDSGQLTRVLSFNIGCNCPLVPTWPRRKDIVNELLRFYQPDIIGLQEATYESNLDIEKGLTDFEWIGVGRDDGKSDGEFNTIFFNTKRLELLNHDTFWLCADSTKPGRGWDAVCHRIVTWARFKDRVSQKEFYHFNTHFDHLGHEAKRASGRLMLERVKEIAEDIPVVITGDFNSKPGSVTYRILTKGSGSSGAALHDAYVSSETPAIGRRRTWRGFFYGLIGAARFDYIFVKNDMLVSSYQNISPNWKRHPASDHHPILAEVRIGG